MRVTIETAELDVRWIAERIADNLMLLDLDGRIEYLNDTPRYMSRDQLVGSLLWAHVEPAYEPIIRACLARVRDTGRPDHYSARYVGPNGVESEWESRVAPMRRCGELAGFIVVSTDLTERNRQITEREHLEHEVRQSRLTGAAGKRAAHDFDHLLHEIETTARLVERRAADPGIAGYVQQITAAVQSGIALTQRLRAGSESEATEPPAIPRCSAIEPLGGAPPPLGALGGSLGGVGGSRGAVGAAGDPAGLPARAAVAESILVAEDNELVRRVLVHLLDDAGYDVVTAADGYEALRAVSARTAPVHAAILDVRLPGITGPHVARELASAYPGMKILFVTGYTEPAELERAGVSNAAILRKPFTQQQLLDQLRALLAA